MAHGIAIEFHGSAESLDVYRRGSAELAGFHVERTAARASDPLLARLEPRLPYLRIDVKPKPDGIAIVRDGIAARPGIELPVDPGKHTIEVSAPGYESVRREIDVKESAHAVLTIDLVVAAPATPTNATPTPVTPANATPTNATPTNATPAPVTPTNATPADSDDGLSGLQLGGLVLGGVGVATLGASLVTGLLATGEPGGMLPLEGHELVGCGVRLDRSGDGLVDRLPAVELFVAALAELPGEGDILGVRVSADTEKEKRERKRKKNECFLFFFLPPFSDCWYYLFLSLFSLLRLCLTFFHLFFYSIFL
jgi:hypothetical protein